jgi:ketosteroid isomerase-like protein
MESQTKTLVELENRFWQSIVDEDTDTALGMLAEPSLMVSSHGAMKFGHDEYRKMAEHGPKVLKTYRLSDVNVVFPNESTAILTYHATQTMAPRGSSDGGTTQEMNDTSTWVKTLDGWKCVMHTESPAGTQTQT